MRSTQEVARLFLSTPRSERPKRFIPVSEAAEIIGMNRRTIQRWVERGDLEAARIGNRLWIVRASLHEQVTHRYGAHGVLVETTDARGITATRTLDGLRRVTLVDYPDPALDTSYVYDQAPTACSSDQHEGRLAEVIRNGTSIPYCYDALGRTTRDGELTYAYDLNSNRTQITYPNNVVATYTHDLVSDREETLTLQVGTDPAQTLVSSAAYLPGGPLTSAGLGNGLTETRTYTDRYYPTAIDVPGITTLAYTTDAMGNITRIDRSLLGNTYLLLYKYQDTQYFLTQGHGPWGQRTWTYDKIGNRLTENRGASDANNPLPESSYTYGLNPAGGNTPKLLEVTGPLGDEELVSSHSFAYDGAGNQNQIAPDAGSSTLLSYDDASRLTTLGDGSDETSVTYDGRGFLTLSHRTTTGSADYLSTEAVYDSQGLLHCVERSGSQVGLTFDESTYVLYFAGRPIAQVTVDNQGVSPDEVLYLTTDHLGTPIAATDSSGVATWQGGLSPFGMPYSYADTGGGGGDPGDGGALMYSAAQSVLASSPEEAGVFLRFPGQWDDGTFEGYVPGGVYQNVHRWYLAGTGRYSRPDPVFQPTGNAYVYSSASPTVYVDPLGLAEVRIIQEPTRYYTTRQRYRSEAPCVMGWSDACTARTTESLTCVCYCSMDGGYKMSLAATVTIRYFVSPPFPVRIAHEDLHRSHLKNWLQDHLEEKEKQTFDTVEECDNKCLGLERGFPYVLRQWAFLSNLLFD